MELKGKIHKIFDTVHVSSTFAKRAFVVEVSEEGNDGETYSQLIQFEFVQDKCELLDKYRDGQVVEVLFNIRGRKWTSPQGEDKYFNTLQAWQIHSEKSDLPKDPPQPPQANANVAPAKKAEEPPPMPEEDESDIPF